LSDRYELSIIIPAFNEAGRLREEAERLHQAVMARAVDPTTTELIVVDDGSTDDTALVSEIEFGQSFPTLSVLRRNVNSGKGAAIRDGVAAARAPVVVFMDVDMAVDPLQIPLLLSAMKKADVAIGSRSVPGSIVQSDNFRRTVMGRAFSRYVDALTGMGIRDTQCGFKAFRTPVARLLFHCMAINRFAFDVELLYLARRLQFDVAEVPVHWRDVSGSAVRSVADPFSMVVDVMRMRIGRRPPVIPALSVSGGDSHEAVTALLLNDFGEALPVVQLEQHRTDLLFPLSEAEDVRRAALRIRDLIPGCDVHEHAVSVDDLIRSSPAITLRSDWSNTPSAVDPALEATALNEELVHLTADESPIHQDQESLPLPGT
jgi:Glycosyl transferase family 2